VPATQALRRRSAPAGEQPEGSVGAPGNEDVGLVCWLRSDVAPAQFVRFVLVGGSTTALYAVLFLLVAHYLAVDYMAAHVGAIVVSTVLANELHRRLTFRAEDRVGWFAAQWEAGSVSLIGLVATSTALSGLDAATGMAHHLLQIGVVGGVIALIGTLRFVALRWIFRTRPDVRA
jgi:putative flippase GtrA